MAQDELPPIAALFVVVFDQKVGYKIAWQRCLPDTDIDGIEYQALPSGLHSVREDLVYFSHGSCAGVSAFAQEESDKQHRNASFAAVGVLVPLSDGRLGKSWLHAEALRELAREQAKKQDDTGSLEAYWQKHGETSDLNRMSPAPDKLASQLNGHKKGTSLSNDFQEPFAAEHPALSMLDLLSTFGPLLFPLHRAALLRKRILLLGSTPVQPSCTFVYVLCLVSEVDSSRLDTIQLDDQLLLSQPLFNVGISDITRLEKHEHGWLACTTDDILGQKKKLYDLLVELPTPVASASRRAWPKLRMADGRSIKASRRDFRRYRALRMEIERYNDLYLAYRDDESAGEDDREEAPLFPTAQRAPASGPADAHCADPVAVEPETWGAAAYRSVMWWSSADEMEAQEAEEVASDQALLSNLPDLSETPSSQHGHKDCTVMARILIAYFHRLTTTFLQTLAGIVEADETDGEHDVGVVDITADHMRALGLDSWAQNDRDFVIEAVKRYLKREAAVREDGVWMCGVRIC